MYVDRHEDDHVVSDRRTYLKTNFALEIYRHCWIQMTKRKYLTLQFKKESRRILEDKSSTVIDEYVKNEFVHFYTDEEGKQMVEMHVDDIYSYNNTEENLPPLPSLGGNLSVRKPKESKAKLVFGQDEAIYRSSQQNDSCWTVDGKITLCTKYLVTGVMVSDFCARVLGFGSMLQEQEQNMQMKKQHVI